MPTTGPICSQCNDAIDIVSPLNGSIVLPQLEMENSVRPLR
jgi:hypothetical protein